MERSPGRRSLSSRTDRPSPGRPLPRTHEPRRYMCTIRRSSRRGPGGTCADARGGRTAAGRCRGAGPRIRDQGRRVHGDAWARISSSRSQTARGWSTPRFSTGMPRSRAMRMPIPVPPFGNPSGVQQATAWTGVSVSAARMLTFLAWSLRAAGEHRCHAGCRAAATPRQRWARSAPSVRQSGPVFPRYRGQGRNRVRVPGGAPAANAESAPAARRYEDATPCARARRP